MRGFKKIDVSTSLSIVSQLLLRIIEGVFEWNGEQYFCPFLTLKDKKNIYSIKRWSKIGLQGKYVLARIDSNKLVLFADPVDPQTLIKNRLRVMDKSVGIDTQSIIYHKERLMIIKNGNRVDVLRFVRKLSDDEREKLFPVDGLGSSIRHFFLKVSRGENSFFSEKKLVEKWNKYLKEETVLT